MLPRVVVVGAGFGGLELASVLSDAFGDELDLTLIDRSSSFVFGFAKLDILFSRTTFDAASIAYAGLARPGVRFVQETVTGIDAASRRVTTDAGVHDADVLVLALGADYDLDSTPGLAEGGYEFYSHAGVQRAAVALRGFERGRVVIGVCGAPFKCPPAVSECALLVDELLTTRGTRDDSEITLVVPTPVPVTSSQAASRALAAAFSERGIEFVPGRRVTSLQADRRVAVLDDGAELPYDLFLGVPRHRPSPLVAGAGVDEGGYIQVDPQTLRTTFDGVYAVGDVTAMTVPKAGTFAEGQARAVAAAIIASVRGGEPAPPYVGRGACYVEFGHGRAGRIDVDFTGGPPPADSFNGPSAALVAEKQEFTASRRARWFS